MHGKANRDIRPKQISIQPKTWKHNIVEFLSLSLSNASFTNLFYYFASRFFTILFYYFASRFFDENCTESKTGCLLINTKFRESRYPVQSNWVKVMSEGIYK